MDEAKLRARYLPPYQAAIDAGARTIMVSFSSWNGTKMHANDYLLTDVFKGELGFDGFLVSDWAGIDQIPGDYAERRRHTINAGIDMVMVPYDYETFIRPHSRGRGRRRAEAASTTPCGASCGSSSTWACSSSRPRRRRSPMVGSAAHRALAREAVQRSLVLLKNATHAAARQRRRSSSWPARRRRRRAAERRLDHHDQGSAGDVTPGTTILDGIPSPSRRTPRIEYDPGRATSRPWPATPGRRRWPRSGSWCSPSPRMRRVRRSCRSLSRRRTSLVGPGPANGWPLVVVLLSGRPLVVTEQLSEWDAFVVAWLPGPRATGLLTCCSARRPSRGACRTRGPDGTISFPSTPGRPRTGCDGPLFPLGFGLTTDESPPPPFCPEG